ncbi:hypothetical protein ACFOWX_09245 [Sphingorhabdus arenilitoris]|uniref:Restriction endonuclease n=1 Tax=Sphingorhabdus arenilitoris TaxID=1490041 RepID=A0ABV8RI91_9SPHN
MTYKIKDRWNHSKAAEEHINVIFDYPEKPGWDIAFPIRCRRAGLELEKQHEVEAYVKSMYEMLNPENWPEWQEKAKKHWAKSRSTVTKPIFDKMAMSFAWFTYNELPTTSNPARRLQDLKEAGFTIGTRRRSGSDLEFILLPKPIGEATGYEYWSGALRNRIVKTLKNYDAYEGKVGNPKHLLPDHKFPEIRWDRNTKRDSLEDLTDAEIHSDFQLITNQRNQQKREVCRKCLQTGKRGHPFGIQYFYKGDIDWPIDVQTTGKGAEAGCHGCGWYDLEKWRQSLQKLV